MKHKTLPVFFLFIAASLAHGQQAAQPLPPLVSTTGNAEIHVKPDRADLSFEIEIRSANLALARKQQAAITAKVLAALRDAGITEQELQTSQVAIEPNWSERSSLAETATLKFYSVSQTICCTLHDVTKVPDITTAAIAAGVTGVSPAVFRISDLRKYRDQARAQAIQAAKEKATALATELGAKVGRPYSIDEYEASANWGSANRYSHMAQAQVAIPAPAGADNPLPAFAPGTITVSASIHVSFMLE